MFGLCPDSERLGDASMKKHLSTLILLLISVVGLGLILYPTISDYINSLHSSRAIASYLEQVEDMGTQDKRIHWDNAVAYNKSLLHRPNSYILTEEQTKQYFDLLNVSGNGIMGYVVIEQLNISLPIYHGTDDAVLQTAVGHLDWTSLPVGGASTHCVLSGHRGLPSAKLFTDLAQMQTGDLFMLQILDETLTYEVDQILIVEPQEVDALLITPGMDYCTLLTCTPYGVNSHRLMVRGHRIENQNETTKKVVRITAEAIQINNKLVAVLIASPLVLLYFIFTMLRDHFRKKRRRKP